MRDGVYVWSYVCTHIPRCNKSPQTPTDISFGAYSLPWHYVSALATVNTTQTHARPPASCRLEGEEVTELSFWGLIHRSC